MKILSMTPIDFPIFLRLFLALFIFGYFNLSSNFAFAGASFEEIQVVSGEPGAKIRKLVLSGSINSSGLRIKENKMRLILPNGKDRWLFIKKVDREQFPLTSIEGRFSFGLTLPWPVIELPIEVYENGEWIPDQVVSIESSRPQLYEKDETSQAILGNEQDTEENQERQSEEKENSEKKENKTKAVSDETSSSIELAAYLGINSLTSFYTNYSYGHLSLLNFGFDFNIDFTEKWATRLLYRHLIHSFSNDPNGVSLTAGESQDFTNQIYKLSVHRKMIDKKDFVEMSFGIGYLAANLKGLIASSTNNGTIEALSHQGIPLMASGVLKISKTWDFWGSISYIYPLTISEASDFSGDLWWESRFGLDYHLGENSILRLAYELRYYQSDVQLDSGLGTELEFLMQTILIGYSYQFNM